jgi:hypothetical protein
MSVVETPMSNLLASRSFLQRGMANLRQNAFAAAVPDFDAAIRCAPVDPYAHWVKATALLSMGDYRNGFKEHEWGWRLFNWRGFGPVQTDIDRLQASLPMWHGRSERVLLYHELGWGDAIMCFRFLPELMQRSDVTLVLDPCLTRLAQQFGVKVVERVPDDLSAFDSRLPFFSAMCVLDKTVETIPGASYIKAELAPERGAIGISWSGRTQKMFSAHDFTSMLQIGGSPYSLQPGPTPPGVAPLEVSDFADTVKTLERMEHIITVDTALAHLAGAIGHPSVHLLLPFLSDWRWWRVSAWYPRITTYRQPQPGDDWRTPFAQINATLNQPATTGDIDG